MSASVIDLTSLTAAQGFIVQGDIERDQAGRSVSSAGDINGDGFADLIVGAPYGDNGGLGAGEAYVIFGKAGATRTNIDLTELAASDGFIIQGEAAGDRAGRSVSSAGDINGDGFADLIVGAPYGTSPGEASVIFGKAGATRTNIDLASLAPSDGFIIQGDAAGDRAGRSVSSAGDINGDGFADMIVGAPLGDDGGDRAGEAYVIYGKAGATRTNIDLTDLTASDGFIIQGDDPNDQAGLSVSSAGDINGDGFADLIVGAPFGANGGNLAGEAYVIFGKAGATRTNIDLTNLAASDGFIIQGDAEFDNAGRSVASAGDINGDGFADLIVGAPYGDNGGDAAGEAYVIFGKAGATRANIDLTSLAASDGFIIQGDDAGNWAGWSVSSAGDINGDGFADLIVGAPNGDNGGSDAGEAYVIFGKAGATRANIDLTALAASDGFIIQGDDPNDEAGFSVSTAGDTNGDGFADLIVGASGGDNGGQNAGEAYVIYGNANFGSEPAAVDDSLRAVQDQTATYAAFQLLRNDTSAFPLTVSAVSNAVGGTVVLNADQTITFTPTAGFIGIAGFDYIATDGAQSDTGRVTITVEAPVAAATIDLTGLTPAQGFIIQGDAAFDRAGTSVSSAGDINGDGFADLIVGAPFSNETAGAAYVIFGRAGATRANIDITELAASEGFVIQGDTSDDRAGRSVSSAGDINGDGFADLIVGAHYGDNGGFNAGEAYVVFGKAGATRTNIDLTDLTASDGFIIQGDDENNLAGFSVSSAGDINGDGFADLIVGAPLGNNGGSFAGEAYVIFGRAGATRANIALTSLAASDGFIIQGDDPNNVAGLSVSSAGDINGDGFADLIVGAPSGTNGGNNAGEAYVIFGKAGATRANIDLTFLAASDGFIIQGDVGGDNAGRSVSSAGDINGDGFADLIVGAPYGDDGGDRAGEAYVIYGKAGATRANIDLTFLAASDGFIIQGDAAGDYAGWSVSSAGDINGDGFADLIVGARKGSNGGREAGEAYVIFGKAGATRANIDLTALAASDGFIIQGDAAGDYAGFSVSTAGDINGDGFADLIVGASGGDNGGDNAGEAYVIYGRADIGANQAPTAAPVTLTAISEDSDARIITAAELLAGAADADGQALTITALTLTSGNGTLTANGDGTWSYTPAADDDSAATFAYTVSDGSLTASSTASLDITPADDAPVITSNGGGAAASVSMAENDTAVTTITATDIDAGTTLTYSISGGADAARFQIDAATGALAFIAAPNFEAPSDVGADNVYDVIVRASDGTLFDDQAIAITVTDGVDTFTGTPLMDTLTGTNGLDIIFGLGDKDTLDGLDGADVLDGGTEADRMSGGAGDDTYYVDNIGDRTIERVNEGTDTVFSSVSFNLAATFIERLELTGLDAIDATGNSQTNTLTGNDAANVLGGLGGNDTLDGLGGADVLDGGTGADRMSGGSGDDTYYVDNIGDRTIERAKGGFDTVFSSVSFNLAGTFIERLELTGTDALSATGNLQINILIGNDGANVLSGLDNKDTLNGLGGADVLDGGTGADRMFGGSGDDTYYVDNIDDRTIERVNEGFDTVFSSVSYILAGTFIEQLELTGLDAIDATGNSQANTLIGNEAANALSGLDRADVLDGRGGADTLSGGTGQDTFAFSTALGAGNIDTISDFSVVDDTIQLAKAIFTGLSGDQLADSAFFIGAEAGTTDHRIIYNSASGALLFDSDGSGATDAVQFATLAPGLALTAADFVLI